MEESPANAGDLAFGGREGATPAPELRSEGLAAGGGGGGSAGEGAAVHPRVSSLAAASAARYKAMSPGRLPIATRAPCLTIPQGFSPSALLESPVFLTNIKARDLIPFSRSRSLVLPSFPLNFDAKFDLFLFFPIEL